MNSYNDLLKGFAPCRLRRQKRKAAIIVLAALFMVFMLALMAFSIDIGYLLSARTEMQRTADAAALAGASAMVNDNILRKENWNKIDTEARRKAAEYAALNEVVNTNPQLELAEDVSIGFLANPSDHSEVLSFPPIDKCNTVQVRVRYSNDINKPISFFFAPVMGIFSHDLSATAAATFSSGNTAGIRVTEETGNSALMPFAVKIDDWKALVDGAGEDNWAFDPDTGAVSPGQDGIRELRMFPEKATGSLITPGNFGTIDIGDHNNSATELSRQILEGPSAADFAHYPNNELKLDPVSGTIPLNGNTGVTVSIKAALNDVVGQARTICLYREATGQGDQTWFTIVGFVGVRIVDSTLTGNNKYVLIQPAVVSDPAAVLGDSASSYFVGPPVQLVR